MTARIFKLPSTYDERLDLVKGLTIMCARILGSPTRQANIGRWEKMEMPELRCVHQKWCKLISAHEEGLMEQKLLTEYATISVPLDSIPHGGKLIEAYETKDEIIVCGDPPDEEEDSSEETGHNCDQMGCTSVSHVIYRFTKEI